MLKTATGGFRTALFLFQILMILPSVSLAQTQASPDDRVAAVNGAPVHKAEFEAALHQALQPWAAAEEDMRDDRLRALRKDVLENLIGRRLAYQESQRLGIQVDSGLVDREMERASARFSTAADFDQALNGGDLSKDRLRMQFRQDIAIRLLIEEQVLQYVAVSDREVRAFYDNHPNLFKTPALVKASHIFIAAGPESTREERQAAVEQLRTIQDKLAQGVAFTELAIDYSQCSSSENGGDLGYFEKEKMIKGFAEAAFALNPGEVSDLVRTSQGYHLIMVEDRKPKMKLAFEDIREKLRQNLKFEKAAGDIKVYLQTLREAAEVEIFLHL